MIFTTPSIYFTILNILFTVLSTYWSQTCELPILLLVWSVDCPSWNVSSLWVCIFYCEHIFKRIFFFKGARMPVEIPGTWLQYGYRETWYLLLQISLSCYLFLYSLLDRRFWDCLGKYKFELHLHMSQAWVSDFSKTERCFGSLL